ncbi:MAG: prepilin-type N-terminal cleavage/methylation domain-containing protein [Nitrospirota bacterium]|nr:MAG: prepilin-type N-terminal cleavage/methylation domain-containing protein [Nitrospirota bacterium]
MRSTFLTLPVRRQSNGFSLIEVVIAVSLLSLAIAAVIQVYSINLKNTRKAELYSQAIIHARSVMEESLSSESLKETDESLDIDDTFTVSKRIAVLPSEEEAIAETYEITVIVEWQGGSFELKATKSTALPEEE